MQRYIHIKSLLWNGNTVNVEPLGKNIVVNHFPSPIILFEYVKYALMNARKKNAVLTCNEIVGRMSIDL